MRPIEGLEIVKTGLGQLALPADMIGDIVAHDTFADGDERFWAPVGDGIYSRPLCLNVSQGYWVHLLKVKKPGVINRHRHSSQVHVMTLKGHWHYPERDWVASAGTYVFEPPGEVHTLEVPPGGAEMVFLAFVTGVLQYVDQAGALTGYDDVFTRIDAARAHYEAIGLGGDYVRRFVR